MRSLALCLWQVGALYLLQVGAAIRLSFSDRANFWLQLGGMGLNNGFVLLMWFLFFAGFRSVGSRARARHTNPIRALGVHPPRNRDRIR